MGPYLKLVIRSLSLMCLVQATWARYATFGSGLFHFISHILNARQIGGLSLSQRPLSEASNECYRPEMKVGCDALTATATIT